MHTKKTTNTNKLIQISYHSVLIKIQKKKKVSASTTNTSRYCLKLVGIAGTWLEFKLVRNIGVSISIYVPVQYMLANTIGIGTVSTTLNQSTATLGQICCWQPIVVKINAMTSLKDVSLALELGINTTIFEGDSKILTKALQEGEPCMALYGQSLKILIKLMVIELQWAHFDHIHT